VTDGKTVYVPALLEQIEAAGVHSGDSTMILPPVKTSFAQQTKIEAIVQTIGQALAYKGALNIQFVLKGDIIYVLEINPRASRTVPIVSKVTGEPLIEWATLAAVGQELATIVPDARPVWNGYAIKTPVFSSLKLPGIDPLTGPIMRSTGETLQFSMTPYVSERFCYDATTTRVMNRTEIVAGQGWSSYSDQALDETTEFQNVSVLFSNVPEEQTAREAAVRNGVHVISEIHLADYYQQAMQAEPMSVRSLQTMQTGEGLPL
jgi:carbamoyl-phosphate synthase large subunit